MSNWYWGDIGTFPGATKVPIGVASDKSNFTEILCSFITPWNQLPIKFSIKKSNVEEYFSALQTYESALSVYQLQLSVYETMMEAYPQALADYEAELAAWRDLIPPRPAKPVPPDEPVKPVFLLVEPERHFGRVCYNIQTHLCILSVDVTLDSGTLKIYLDKCQYDDRDYVDEMMIQYKTKVVQSDLIIAKVADSSKSQIAGATFELSGTHNNENIIFSLHNIEDADATLSSDNKTITFITTDTQIHFTDLLPGYYTLTETQAPSGYVAKDPLAFYIDADGEVILSESSDCELSTTTDRIPVLTVLNEQVSEPN